MLLHIFIAFPLQSGIGLYLSIIDHFVIHMLHLHTYVMLPDIHCGEHG